MSEKNQKHDSGANVIKAERQINLGEAVLVFIMSIVVIGYPALSKQFPIAMGILLALVLCCTYAMLALKISWDSLFDSITKTIAEVLFGLLFCLFVGFISASWIASGTIPFLFYWGLKLLNPDIFLFVAFLITSFASFFTGQPWALLPSIGLAFMGIGTALGVPAPLAAAAIVSGCFVGDVASPINEVPVIASVSAGTADVIGTIKSTLIPFIPGMIVGAVAYFFIGMNMTISTAQVHTADSLINSLAQGFNLTVLTLIPLVVIFALVFIKFPILPGVIIASLIGMAEAVILQGETWGGVTNMMWSGYVCSTGDQFFYGLLTRGGIMDFAGTIIMLLFAFSFAGVIKRMGMLERIMNSALKKVENSGFLVLYTSITTLIGVSFTGSANVSSLLNGSIYKDAYRKKGVHPEVLARTMSMNGALWNAMLPWSASGALCLSVLGVNNFEYTFFMIPFWTSFILNIVFAFMGKFTRKLTAEEMGAQADTA